MTPRCSPHSPKSRVPPCIPWGIQPPIRIPLTRHIRAVMWRISEPYLKVHKFHKVHKVHKVRGSQPKPAKFRGGPPRCATMSRPAVRCIANSTATSTASRITRCAARALVTIVILPLYYYSSSTVAPRKNTLTFYRLPTLRQVLTQITFGDDRVNLRAPTVSF